MARALTGKEATDLVSRVLANAIELHEKHIRDCVQLGCSLDILSAEGRAIEALESLQRMVSARDNVDAHELEMLLALYTAHTTSTVGLASQLAVFAPSTAA